jgi:hypothetical protein
MIYGRNEEQECRTAVRRARWAAVRVVCGLVLFALWVWVLAGAVDQALGR